jgi:hypothetical protein
MTKKAGSGSISQRHGSADPDPLQYVMDPGHCFFVSNFQDANKKRLFADIFTSVLKDKKS